MTALRWRPSPHVLLLLLLSLVVIAPLAQPGYFWGAHDARHDVYFIFQYDRSVLEGDWMPRWGPDWAFGYGYPFWIIYAPLAVIAGEAFHHFLGFGWEASVKAVLALSVLGSGLAMYGFVRSWLGRNAALVAGVAYMAIPYHLVDVYVRAALPESVALALLPLALWAFRSLSLRPTRAGILAAGIAYSALWWTHNLTAAIFTPLLGLYILALLWWRAGEDDLPAAPVPARGRLARAARSALAPLAAGLLGLGLSAAFLLPAILETRYINQSQWFGAYYNPFQHFVYFFQLFQPAWGYGISLPGPAESEQGSLSYQLGAAIVVLALVSLAGASRRDRGHRRELWLLAGWAVLAVFLTLGLSAFAWRYIPLVPYAQFPWRYLLLAILPLSVLAGSVVAESPEFPAEDERPSRSLGWAAAAAGCDRVIRQLPVSAGRYAGADPGTGARFLCGAHAVPAHEQRDDRGHCVGRLGGDPYVEPDGRRVGAGRRSGDPRRLQPGAARQPAGRERRRGRRRARNDLVRRRWGRASDQIQPLLVSGLAGIPGRRRRGAHPQRAAGAPRRRPTGARGSHGAGWEWILVAALRGYAAADRGQVHHVGRNRGGDRAPGRALIAADGARGAGEGRVIGSVLRGERVRLVPLREEDLKLLGQWQEDAVYARLLDARPSVPDSPKDVQEYLDEVKKSKNGWVFGIRLVEGDELIGFVELDGIMWTHGGGWIGIGIGPAEHRDQGYGREAMELIIDFAFREVNLHRVQLSVFDYNERARALYEKLGFQREGTLREALHRDGRRYDMHLYGLLRREWEARRGAGERSEF